MDLSIYSTIPWQQIDTNQLRRYLSLIVDWSIISKHKLDKCVPKPKPRTTLNSYTNPSKRAKETNCDSLFNPPLTEPTSQQIRTMISLVVSEGVKVVMSNHYYTFGGHIYRQRDGGGIGTEIEITSHAASATVIDSLMNFWIQILLIVN